MANEFDKMGLGAKDKLIVKLLEEILDELKLINRNNQGTRPSPS